MFVTFVIETQKPTKNLQTESNDYKRSFAEITPLYSKLIKYKLLHNSTVICYLFIIFDATILYWTIIQYLYDNTHLDQEVIVYMAELEVL